MDKNRTDNTNPFRQRSLREGINTILFDLHHPWGRNANMFGMLVILGSVLLSMVGTLDRVTEQARELIHYVEIIITLLFAMEYLLRAYSAHQPPKYLLSFYGLVDLFTWLPLLLFGDVFLAIRLLRILRLLKLLRYLRAIRLFFASMIDVFDIVFVVLATIIIMVLVSGNLIHFLEPETFGNAFMGCWWAIVTMTTVGYGDIVPATTAGKLLASVVMMMGITMFALLTGTISIKLSEHVAKHKECIDCGEEIAEHAPFCEHCGAKQRL
ncbi:MAG: ion transporter [Candidatus Sedimenticola sp. (ex Thyasira tokunagai)]